MKIKFLTSNKLDCWILSVFVIFLVVSNIIWLKIDIQTPHWDGARHLLTSLKYYDLIANWFNDISNLHNLKSIVQTYYYYPPFYYLSTIPMYFIFGKSADSAVLVNTFYIIMLVFSVYGIGKILWNRTVGLLSSFYIALTPMILSSFREYMIDMPMIAFVALSFYLLLKSNKFQNTLYSILLGISLACGMLTKWMFPIFLAGPILYFVVEIIINNIKKWDFKIFLHSVKGSLICVSIFTIIAGPWYHYNLNQLKIDFRGNALISVPEKGSFLLHFVNVHTYLIMFIFVLIGLIVSFSRVRYFKKNLLIILSILFPLVALFLLTKNYDARYSLPWLVYGTILATFWITLIKNKVLKVACIIIFSLVLIFNFYSVSFGLNFLPKQLLIKMTNKISMVIYNQYGYTVGPPKTDDWKIEQIIGDIDQDAKIYNTMQPTIFTSCLDDHFNFNNWDLYYYAFLNYDPVKLKFEEPDKIYLTDYIITRLREPKINPQENKCKIFETFSKKASPIPYQITLVKEYPLPQYTKAQLYRIKIDHTKWNMDLKNININFDGEIISDDNQNYIFVEKGNDKIAVWGPYLPFNEGKYRLRATMKIADNSLPEKVASIDASVYNNPDDSLYYGNLEIKGSDFDNNDEWQEFEFDFQNPDHIRQLEFRVLSAGNANLYIKNLSVEKIN